MGRWHLTDIKFRLSYSLAQIENNFAVIKDF